MSNPLQSSAESYLSPRVLSTAKVEMAGSRAVITGVLGPGKTLEVSFLVYPSWDTRGPHIFH